jgi:hypothetical protein
MAEPHSSESGIANDECLERLSALPMFTDHFPGHWLWLVWWPHPAVLGTIFRNANLVQSRTSHQKLRQIKVN